MTTLSRNLPGHPNRRQTLFALVGAALLPACGGGTDVAGISSGGTGSFTTGVIVGIGSVIVNGIRYDDDAASISFNGASATAAALQLGMVVRIRGSAVTPATTAGELATATASSIACGSEWKGRIDAVDTTAGTFTLLGQTVRVLATTVFANGNIDRLLAGQYAEVYGFLNPADNSLQASRVEVDSAAPDRYRLSGVVANLNSTTFELGTALINHATAEKPVNLSEGQLVRVELQTTPADGVWLATEVKVEDYSDDLDDEDEAEIEGAITTFTPNSPLFSVNGIPVDASRVSDLPSLSLGTRVEVKGSILNGTVLATEVEVEDDKDIEAQAFEFHGTVSAIDTTARTFVVRGYTLHYDGTTAFDLHGAIWDASLSTPIEAKARLKPNGELLATEVDIDH